MAKKSARSKGYRKTYAKRPYLTKKEIYTAAGIVVALILAVVLFNIFYDDGSLEVVDGAVVTEGNSLIVNRSNTTTPRYFKLGQVAEVEGYTLEGTPLSDVNILEYTYTPEAESAIDLAAFDTYGLSAEYFSNLVLASVSASETITASELATTEVSGHDVLYFFYTQDNTAAAAEEESTEEAAETEETSETEEAAESEEPSETEETEPAEETPDYVQELLAFVAIDDQSCISLMVRNNADTEADLVEETVLTDAMDQFLAALSYETK